MSEWQPIETAPKDKSILIWTKWGYPVIANWCDEIQHFPNGDPVEGSGWLIFNCDDPFYNVVLTGDEAAYWGELPTPPFADANAPDNTDARKELFMEMRRADSQKVSKDMDENKTYDDGDFVKYRGNVHMVINVDRRNLPHCMDRFTLQDVNGVKYHNIGAYELSPATEKDAQVALSSAPPSPAS